MAIEDDLAAQVDAAFTEQLGEPGSDPEKIAHKSMGDFEFALSASLSGDPKYGRLYLYEQMIDSETPVRTGIRLCAAGAGVIACLLDDLTGSCDLHESSCECNGRVQFDLDSVGEEGQPEHTALLLCNAVVRCDHDEMSMVLTNTYHAGGLTRVRQLLLNLIDLYITVREDMGEAGA